MRAAVSRSQHLRQPSRAPVRQRRCCQAVQRIQSSCRRLAKTSALCRSHSSSWRSKPPLTARCRCQSSWPLKIKGAVNARHGLDTPHRILVAAEGADHLACETHAETRLRTPLKTSKTRVERGHKHRAVVFKLGSQACHVCKSQWIKRRSFPPLLSSKSRSKRLEMDL